MKLLFAFVLAGLAVAASQASLLNDAGPLLDQVEKMPVLLQRARGSVSLREALGVPESTDLDQLETKIRADLGQKIREFLEKILGNLEELGQNAYEALKQLLESLFKESPTEENAEKLISMLSSVQQRKFSSEQILSHTLDVSQSSALVWYSIEERGISEWWDKIKEWFTGIGSWISDKFDKFKDWAKEVFHKVIDAAKPLVEQVKQLAVEFLKNNWDTMSVELVKQALEFFWPNSGVLGEQIMKQLIELARKFGLTPWENKFYLLA